MFLVSLKSLKVRFILLFCAIVALSLICAVFTDAEKSVSAEMSVTDTVNINASSEKNRLDFISGLGYSVKDEPDSVEEIIIPREFDEIFTQYNRLQKECGFDLEPYRGLSAKKWCYTITDYPGYEGKDCIKINLIICSNRIIGADICSVELDGFMHAAEKRNG